MKKTFLTVLNVFVVPTLVTTVGPLNSLGLGCPEANLDYDDGDGDGTVHANVFDLYDCENKCVADAACVLAVFNGVSKTCSTRTKFSVPFIVAGSDAKTALYKYCCEFVRTYLSIQPV